MSTLEKQVDSFMFMTFLTVHLSSRKGFKLVILDEADAMTQDAQNALRRGKPSARISVANCEPHGSLSV